MQKSVLFCCLCQCSTCVPQALTASTSGFDIAGACLFICHTEGNTATSALPDTRAATCALPAVHLRCSMCLAIPTYQIACRHTSLCSSVVHQTAHVCIPFEVGHLAEPQPECLFPAQKILLESMNYNQQQSGGMLHSRHNSYGVPSGSQADSQEYREGKAEVGTGVGDVMVCSRTAGCAKAAGHQGFCSGHKGFRRRFFEDAAAQASG